LLGVFNLLPIPPLDGSGALPLLLNDDLAERWRGFVRNPGLTWMGLLIAWQVFDPLFQPIFLLALNLLYPGADYR
jgi:Zn-dependent protease